MSERVQLALLRTPVELFGPVRKYPSQVLEVGALLPANARYLIRPTRVADARPEVRQNLFLDPDREGLDAQLRPSSQEEEPPRPVGEDPEARAGVTVVRSERACELFLGQERQEDLPLVVRQVVSARVRIESRPLVERPSFVSRTAWGMRRRAPIVSRGSGPLSCQGWIGSLVPKPKSERKTFGSSTGRSRS